MHWVRTVGFLKSARTVLFLGVRQQMVLGAAYGTTAFLHQAVELSTDQRYVSICLMQALGYWVLGIGYWGRIDRR